MSRARLTCIRRLFSGASRYRCSAFARDFVWGPPEMAQLLLDLEDGFRLAPEKGAPPERMYLGVIAVRPAPRNVQLLVDGQQRLAAIAMLLAFIRDRTNNPGLRRRLNGMLFRRRLGATLEARVTLNDAAQTWFDTRILAPGATLHLPRDVPAGAARSLLFCARFLARAFAAYSMADLQRLARFILNNTAVVMSQAQEYATYRRIHVNMSRPAANDAQLAPARVHRPAA